MVESTVFRNSALNPTQKLQFDIQMSTTLVVAATPLCPWNITMSARLLGCFDMMELFFLVVDGMSRVDA
jgi:hypothetical protein